MLKKKLTALFTGISAFNSQSAFAAFALGSSGGARGIGKFEEYLQDWINFFSGPFGVAVVVGSIILAVSIFVFAPKQGAMGLFGRAVVAGIVIVNLSTVVAGFS